MCISYQNNAKKELPYIIIIFAIFILRKEDNTMLRFWYLPTKLQCLTRIINWLWGILYHNGCGSLFRRFVIPKVRYSEHANFLYLELLDLTAYRTVCPFALLREILLHSGFPWAWCSASFRGTPMSLSIWSLQRAGGRPGGLLLRKSYL